MSETIEQKTERMIDAAKLIRSGYMPTEDDYYSFDEVAQIIKIVIAEDREANASQLAALKETVQDMRGDLTRLGGFDNEMLTVPAGGVRHYIVMLEQVLNKIGDK